MSVLEGDSVTLISDLAEIMDDDWIQCCFGNENTLIAENNKQDNSMTVYDDVLDGRFRDRLKLNNQSGSLAIINTSKKHAGNYKLQSNGVRKRFILSVYGELNILVSSASFL